MEDIDNLEYIKKTLQLNPTEVFRVWEQLLEEFYPKNNIFQSPTDLWLCARGDIPIGLVAHADTVWPQMPREFFYCESTNALWSPTGLGADDRAGLIAILTLLQRGLRPHIIITNEEEAGGMGAFDLAMDTCPFHNLHFLIELDRMGRDDMVFYSCTNRKFTKYIGKFGFKLNWGTFTDISRLCPSWNVAGVNLSVGYYHEHTHQEVWYLNETKATIDKVEQILRAPSRKYVYGQREQYRRCGHCHAPVTADDTLMIQHSDKTKTEYCIHCLPTDKGIEICTACGSLFFTENKVDRPICYSCKEKEKQWQKARLQNKK